MFEAPEQELSSKYINHKNGMGGDGRIRVIEDPLTNGHLDYLNSFEVRNRVELWQTEERLVQKTEEARFSRWRR